MADIKENNGNQVSELIKEAQKYPDLNEKEKGDFKDSLATNYSKMNKNERSQIKENLPLKVVAEICMKASEKVMVHQKTGLDTAKIENSFNEAMKEKLKKIDLSKLAAQMAVNKARSMTKPKNQEIENGR